MIFKITCANSNQLIICLFFYDYGMQLKSILIKKKQKKTLVLYSYCVNKLGQIQQTLQIYIL